MLIDKAMRKVQAKKERVQMVKRKKEALKKIRANKRKKLMKAKRPAPLHFEGEALDPNDLFDEQGNIHIVNLVQHKPSDGDGNVVDDQPKTEDNASEPLCFETYCRDAAAMTDDPND